MSDWKTGAVKRRDARATKAPEVLKRYPGKKDTKRWCAGKVGREHTAKCFPYRELRNMPSDMMPGAFSDWYGLCCTTCGKTLDRYWPTRWLRTEPEPPPAWVVKT